MSLTYGTPIALSSTPAEYVGNFILNTATSVPNATATTIASSKSQWSNVTAAKSINAGSLLNANGSVVLPETGLMSISISVPIQTVFNSTTVGGAEVWFLVTPAAGGFAPRQGWARAGMIQLGTQYYLQIPATSFKYNGYKGDILTPYVFQNVGSTVTLQNDTTNGAGSSGVFTSVGVEMTCSLDKRFI